MELEHHSGEGWRQAYAIGGTTPVACEYAKCKNRHANSIFATRLALNLNAGSPGTFHDLGIRHGLHRLTPNHRRSASCCRPPPSARSPRPKRVAPPHRLACSLPPRNSRARKARSRPAMATGKTKASPRIFEGSRSQPRQSLGVLPSNFAGTRQVDLDFERSIRGYVASLAMTLIDMSPRSRGVNRPSLEMSLRPQRAQGMPGARCTRSPACRKQKSTPV